MFFKSLLVGALAALATAQTNPLGFTRVPNPITVGKPNALTYMTNDDTTPVTILLRRGDANNLQTVSTLTTSATGGQFIWTPSNDLENGSDYALEIQQSGNQPNYYGPFVLQGSTETGLSSSSGTAGGYGTATHSGSSSTITATASYNGTSTTLTATYPVSAGNMTSMSRNQTMSHATLTRSSSTATSTVAETTGAGFQTSSGATPSQTGNSASSFATGSSAIALVFGAVAAIVMG